VPYCVQQIVSSFCSVTFCAVEAPVVVQLTPGAFGSYSYELYWPVCVFALWHAPSAAMSSSLAPPLVEQSLLVKSFIVPAHVVFTLQPQLEHVNVAVLPAVCA
jgi:hypothetical protein